MQSIRTTCCYCGVGCGLTVSRDRQGRPSLRGDPDHPVNQGMLCSKGRTLHHTAMDLSDRLLHPMIRPSRDSEPARVSWDDALDQVASTFRRLITDHGPRSVALYVSGQLLTEEYYVANKLMKGFIGGNNIDTNSRLCMSSAVVGYKQTLGDDACPISYSDIEACSCFLITGANPAWCHPILFRRIERHKEQNPATKIIVVDPRRTQSCAMADLHLQINPGTDVTLYNAIARLLIEDDLIDSEFIFRHTDGFDALRSVAFSKTTHQAARECGVPMEQIQQAARWIGESPTFLSLWAMGLNQSRIAVKKNVALINLSLLTGKIGKPGCGPFSLTGQPNAMGGREVGGLATMLAAHRTLDNAQHRAEVEAFWGCPPIDPRPGLSAIEMLEALECGELKAIWIICTNPAVSWPSLSRAEAALRKAELVVVQDVSKRADTLRFADVILPAAGWLEKAGTMTNSERRITYLPMLLEPPGEARPDWEIIKDVACRLGFEKGFAWNTSAEVYDEYARMTQGMPTDASGVSHARLDAEESLQWPCPSPDHPGTTRLFEDHRFFTPNGRAQFRAVEDAGPVSPPTDAEPFILTTGRIRDQWHTMTRSGKVSKLRRHLAQPFVEIHPADAEAQGIRQGDLVELTNAQGEVCVRAAVTDDIKAGVVFLPMHWGRTLAGTSGRANNLTTTRIDPQSKQPDLKYATVAIRKISEPPHRIVVVGAGAGALQFVQTLRDRRTEDEVHVFGREPQPFYNRVLLPDYISGEKRWDELITGTEAEMARLAVTYHRGVAIAAIDRVRRMVTDAHGVEHAYDRLVLATGSRSFIPPGVPMDKPGLFGLRSREDADRIVQQLRPGDQTVIMGGGLLGLELAASLLHMNVGCTVIEMGPRLMLRQLDPMASEILQEELEDRGVRVICGDAIASFNGDDRIRSVTTKKGLHIETSAVFVAVGTRPNIELAQAAGLDCKRGVVVNDMLQTSDPSIYAIGEIAEHRGMLYGITPTAQEQADVAAAHVGGDPWAQYNGSTLFNILKIHGLDVASVGLAEVNPNDPTMEEIVLLDRRRRFYKKCILQGDRLVGAILIGDKSEFQEFRDLIRHGTELDERRDTLLRSGSAAPKSAPIGRLVCSCNTVGEGNLHALIDSGCGDFASLCEKSRAGTGCGSCRPEVRRILSQRAKVPAIA